MRILYTADLHIRVGQKNIPKDWALNQYKILFDELDRVYEEQDCTLEVHGGDIFDKVPTMQELSIYIEYLNRNPMRDRVIYDGNHEAVKKGSTFIDYLRSMVPKNTKIITEYNNTDYPFDILPYADLHKYKTIEKKHDVLMTHVRGEIPPHVKPEIDLEYLSKWDIVYAGDLHAHKNTQKNIVYPGSPRTVTFHRNKVKLGVLVIDNLKDWKWVEISVPQLIRKTVTSEDEIVRTKVDHTIYELVGSVLDLAKSSSVDKSLVDKKIIQRHEPSKLQLTGLNMEEELRLYLKEVLDLPNGDIEEIIEEYNDCTKNTVVE